MGRPIRPEIRFADMEARRFVQSQLAEARKLGYPRMAAFAKDIARGTISLAPTPEDESLDRVGRFYWTFCNEIERRVMATDYGESHTWHVKARRLGVSPGRMQRLKERILLRLSVYLHDS
jgi:hypothetical protein